MYNLSSRNGRYIVGAIWVDRIWRIRLNNEQAYFYESPTILKEVKARRIKLLGHVHVQMIEETRIPKKMLHSKLEGSRSAGRPQLRWLDDVEADLKRPWSAELEKEGNGQRKMEKGLFWQSFGPKGALEPP